MPNFTTNYNLKKPTGNENYNVEDQNGNMDIIDENLKSLATQSLDMAVYGATCSYASNAFTLVLSNAPATLPNFFTIRFKASNVWEEGSTFKIGTKTYTPVNANFASGDVVIMNFDEVSGKCFSTGSSKLPTNLVCETTTDITYYVATTGSDTTGDGTQANPFKTIQYAINKLPQIINHIVNINISAGTYNEDVLISGFNGKGAILVTGTTSLSDNYIINSLTLSSCGMYMLIQGLKVKTTTVHAVNISGCTSLRLYYIKVVENASSVRGITASQSLVFISNCMISNHLTGISSDICSVIAFENCSGTGNKYGLYSSYGGTIAKSGTQPSGETAEIATEGGVIR